MVNFEKNKSLSNIFERIQRSNFSFKNGKKLSDRSFFVSNKYFPDLLFPNE